MSDSTNSQNNLLHPESPASVAAKRTWDPEFYHDQKVVVLLVGDTLFKFQASLLAPDPNIENYELKPYLNDALHSSKSLANEPGSSDERPIILPKDIEVETFRDLLRVSSGGVNNKEFMKILAATRNCFSEGCDLKFIARLSRLGYVAGRFGMKKLDNWSQSCIYKTLQNSPKKIAQDQNWSTAIILEFVQHMRMTSVPDYRSKILNGIRMAMSVQVDNAYECYKSPKDLSNCSIVRICTEVYKEKSLLVDAPDIFGFVFTVVLSLGHRSPIWENELAREDRRVLLASSTIFTHLCEHTDLDVGWLVKPTDMSQVISDCSACSDNSNFDVWWNHGFGNCKGLNSPIPLEDVRHVVRLSHYRTLFKDAFRASRGYGRWCEKECSSRLLAYVDERMELVYCAFTKAYKNLEEMV